jgi:quercetin dioxygenase-like cupin family protein
MRLSLYEHQGGVETVDGARIVYDVARDEAFFGAATVTGHALVWQLEPDAVEPADARLSHPVALDPVGDWILRCDRVDFPKGGIAYLHTHPGPGIRYLLRGELEVHTEGSSTVFSRGGAWFESGPEPVLAVGSQHEETAFVRVLLLPAEWESKRTIRYLDLADEAKPKLQRATVYFDRRIRL